MKTNRGLSIQEVAHNFIPGDDSIRRFCGRDFTSSTEELRAESHSNGLMKHKVRRLPR